MLISLYTPLDPTLVGGMRTWLERLWLPLCSSGAIRLRLVHTATRPSADAEAYREFATTAWETRIVDGRPAPASGARIPSANALADAFGGSDAVYVDNGYLLQDRVALAAAKAARISCVVSGHHSVILHDWGSISGVLHNAAWLLSGVRALRRFDVAHALNATDASYLRKCGARNVRVVPLPVDTVTFAPAPKSEDFTVLFVGRLHRQKGIDRFCRVIDAAGKRGLPVRFRAIGAGPELHLLQPYIDSGRLSLAGGLSSRAVARVMAEAHVLIAPSRSETFGFVAAEALSAATPVACTATNGFKDLVDGGNGAIVANPDSADAWIDAIERIRQLSHGEYEKLAARARASAERLSYERVAVQMTELFAECTARSTA